MRRAILIFFLLLLCLAADAAIIGVKDAAFLGANRGPSGTNYPANNALFDGVTQYMQKQTDYGPCVGEPSTVTVSVWVKRHADNVAGTIFEIEKAQDVTSKVLLEVDSSNHAHLRCRAFNAALTFEITGTIPIMFTNGWTHIYACGNGANGTLSRLYINGILDTTNSTVSTSGIDYSGTSYLYFIGRNMSGANFWNGALSELWVSSLYLDDPTKFITNGCPVYLGTNGASPGNTPEWYFNGGTNAFNVVLGEALTVCANGNFGITNPVLGSVARQCEEQIPMIVTQPTNTWATIPNTAQFFVEATAFGWPLNYQWSRTNEAGVYTNVPGATSATYTTPALTTNDLFATFRCIAQNGAGSVTSSIVTVFPGVTDWAARVAFNGGGVPSQTTINAMETLRTNLIDLTLTNKIYNMCVFVPDSVGACFTPLFYHKGWGYWTNTFVIGDLNVEGIKGNGSTKMADTGVKASSGEAVSATGSCGLTVIVTEIPRSTNWVSLSAVSHTMIGRADPDYDPETVLSLNQGGLSQFVPGDVTTASYISTNDFCRVGYVSGNQSNAAYADLYVASPLEAHKRLARVNSLGIEITTLANTFTVFCRRQGNTNETSTFTTNRMSMAAIHDYFTEIESSNFWVALKTCRESLGGGNGDPVHDWSVFVTNVGGAAISTTTSNALRNFWQGLDTDNLLYKMVAANCIVPDNLIASRAPLIWQGGYPLWRSFFFDATNLTVNGLAGNGTSKYMATGITNNSATSVNAGRLTDNSGGISVLASTETNGQIMGGTTGAGSTHFTIYNLVGTFAAFYCWGSSSVNLNNLIYVPSPSLTLAPIAFTSGNRTAANAIGIYAATPVMTYTLLTNSTGTKNLNRFAGEMLAWAAAQNTASAPGAYYGGTALFMSVHAGLTQIESSNLWNRAYTFRTNVGGWLGPMLISDVQDLSRQTTQTAPFSVSILSSVPLTYQWQRDGGSGFTNIPSATTSNYTTAALVTNDNFNTFRVLVTNSYGSLTSRTATLYLTDDPSYIGASGWWEPSRGYATNSGIAVLTNLTAVGRGFDLTNSTASLFPVRQPAQLNGLDTLYFAGTGNPRLDASTWTNTAPWEVFVVLAVTNAGAGSVFGGRIASGWDYAFQPTFVMRQGGTFGAVSAVNTNRYVVMNLVWANPASSYLNNVLQASGSFAISGLCHGLRYGCDYQPGNGTRSSLACMITFTNQVLNSVQRSNIFHYCTNRFNIQ